MPAPSSRRALGAAAAAAAVAVPLALGAATPASAATAADWQKLAMCESSGNWSINTGNGYYGGLQFSASTWLAFDGGAYAPRADLATPDQQMAVADRVLAVQGWDAWPVCSRATGLYGTPTTPPPPPPPPPAPPMVYGAIGAHYAALGGSSGFLGGPLTAESGASGGGRFNTFQNGVIYWSSATGAWEVHGMILGDWAALGRERSTLGYPLTDEHDLPGVPGGRVNGFQGGEVDWTAATGAHEVIGAIRGKWYAYGAQTGLLGLPLSDELPVPGRTAEVELFQGGAIGWSPETNARVVHGAIGAAWLQMGGGSSVLGLPTSGEYAVPGGRRSSFEHGTITWTPSGITVTRR